MIKFPYIIYKKNYLKFDISYLSYAYNVVGGYSTFLKNIIILNDNIKKFWIFEFYVSKIRKFFFSFEFNHKNVLVYKMKANNYYKKIISNKSIKYQEYLMLNYKCKNNFKFINNTFKDYI